MADAARWYVVQTYSAYENIVKSTIERTVESRGLQEMIHAVSIPTEYYEVTHVDENNAVERLITKQEAEALMAKLKEAEIAEKEAKAARKAAKTKGEEADGEGAKKTKKVSVVERRVFPSYVLVKMIMSDESWYIIRNIRGVTGFVGSGGKPTPLSEEETIALGVERREIIVNYAVGDTVRIADGPFTSFNGLVEAVDLEKNKVRVVVSMFGRETPIDLELDQVEVLTQ